MLYKPLLADQLSGSIGGIVASHNAGGTYLRVRSIPVHPGTPFQETITAAVADLTVRWNDNLTQLQRDAWDVYGDGVPLLNRIGATIAQKGLPAYVRSNVSRIQAALPRVDDAPTTFNLGAFTEPVIVSVTAATDILSLAFTDTDDWVDETDSAALVYISRPKNPSINFHKSPYRFAGQILGDDTTPPTSPAAIALPFPAAVGNRIFIRFIVTRADGRLSADFRNNDVVV